MKNELDCSECGTKIYRTAKQIKKSSTGNFFCNKSCSAKFTNKIYKKRQKRIRTCPTCLENFTGRNKFCSKDCRPKDSMTKVKFKKAHRMRDLRRKIKLKAVELLGGGCSICGYKKSLRALEFHHLDPTEKDFSISNATSWTKAKEEVEKCILVCSNCHAEIHDKLVG